MMPAAAHARAKRRVLGQKAIAWVNGVGAAPMRAASMMLANRQVTRRSAGAGPMATARSAATTCGAAASAAEWTAMLSMPSSRHGADDPDGDFAAIGDQQPLDHCGGRQPRLAAFSRNAAQTLPGLPSRRAGRRSRRRSSASRPDTVAAATCGMSAFAAAIASGPAVSSSRT